MYTLITFCLLGAALGIPLNSDSAPQNNEHYVLPGESYPTLYDLRLFFNPDNEAFFVGHANIRIIPANNTLNVTLHAMALHITNITLSSVANPNVNLTSGFNLQQDETHFLRVDSSQMLVALQPYILDIHYVGSYAPNMFGVYVSNYEYLGQPYKLITSQLQPTFARRVFPCYDEPHQKAVFKTTIYAPGQYGVIRTNMPERNDLSKPAVPGYVKYEFQDTPFMSTYLLAFLVSNFNFISNEGVQNPLYNIPFRVYSRRGTQNTAQFALDFGQRNMAALENYTQFSYDLPKIDKVAVPDFGAGAMENWGLVVYREVALLVQEGVTTTSTRQNIGRIICHENVHMWFGNEVSPRSWTYTWLNEGFANFFENYGTDLVLPSWRMMDQFVLLLQNVLQSDAVLSVNAMTHAVYTPSEILGTFNAVAYQKSGSVIRMMQHFLTPEVFQNGLAIYIRNNTRRAALPSDLFAALQEALDESDHNIPFSVSVIMRRWTEQGGFPVLTVRRSSPSANSISVHQERYLTDRSQSSADSWHVPINWVLSSNPIFSDTRPLAWVSPNSPALAVDIPGFNQTEWYIVNKQQTGYYRVNYDLANWRALANVLQRSHETIHILNRAQIVDDAFNLARNGRLEYAYAFEVSKYLINETDYIPWGSANAAFEYLDVVLSGTRAYQLFQNYVLGLSGPSYERLGFQPANNEQHVTAFYRNIILNLNCRFGNQHCVNTSQELLQSLRNNPSQNLHPDIQTTVFCSGLRGGSSENFNFLWNRYLASQDSSVQAILLNALGCTSNATLRNFYMNQVIDDNSSVRDQDRHTILVSIINSSPAGTEAALDFIIENFARIQPNVQQLTGTTNILNALGRRLNTQAHIGKIQNLENRHGTIFSAGEIAAVAGIRENVRATIAWNENNYNLVNSWLDNYFEEDGDDDEGNSAHGLGSSLIIIISIFATIVNR